MDNKVGGAVMMGMLMANEGDVLYVMTLRARRTAFFCVKRHTLLQSVCVFEILTERLSYFRHKWLRKVVQRMSSIWVSIIKSFNHSSRPNRFSSGSSQITSLISYTCILCYRRITHRAPGFCDVVSSLSFSKVDLESPVQRASASRIPATLHSNTHLAVHAASPQVELQYLLLGQKTWPSPRSPLLFARR